MVRSPMQVDEEFRKKIKQIQEQIMRKKGKFHSIPKITGEMITMPEWEIIEKRLMENIKQMELITFDRRKAR